MAVNWRVVTLSLSRLILLLLTTPTGQQSSRAARHFCREREGGCWTVCVHCHFCVCVGHRVLVVCDAAACCKCCMILNTLQPLVAYQGGFFSTISGSEPIHFALATMAGPDVGSEGEQSALTVQNIM